MSRRALRLEPEDNVATALDDLVAGEAIALGDTTLTLAEAIPLCHKLAIAPIAKGAAVIKYGHPIGLATRDIKAGTHVHIHNMRSARDRQSA